MLSTLVAAVAVATAPNATEVTVYNGGFGLVKETRTLTLKSGTQTVAVENVAALIEPASVGVKGLGGKDVFTVLEQNYRFDLISPLAILNKSVGSRVRFVRAIGGQREVLEGVLISAPTAIVGNEEGGSHQTYNGMVIRTDDGRIVLNPTGEIEVREVPAGLISRPTLFWEINAPRGGETPIELAYITNGLGWSADYVLTLGEANRADLQGWVTLNNSSGATYENARLKLLAGEVQRVQERMRRETEALGMRTADAAAPQFQEESLFEYHLYTLQRPTTLRDREIKQVSLLEGNDIPVRKRLVVDAMRPFGMRYPHEGEIGVGNIKPQVRLEFTNDKESNLGMPLPMGRVKVYQRDKAGSVQLLGEDRINHTPRNERLSLVVGHSFDVVASRRRTNFRRISQNVVQETFEIEVRNRKETPETVYVLERHYGDWRVGTKSMDFTKLDANTMQFVLELKPNETKTVTYTVDTRW